MYLLDFLDGGLLNLSWWQLIVATLLLTHVTIAGVSSKVATISCHHDRFSSPPSRKSSRYM